MKSGIFTTEFWLSISSQVLTLLVIVGMITATDKSTLEGAVSAAVGAIGVLVSNALIIWKYIAGCVEQKVEHLKTQRAPY